MIDPRNPVSGSLFDFGPLAAGYEGWYDTPEGRMYDAVQQQDVRCLLAPARPGDTLLDVGCGTGHWSRFFHVLGYEVHGVDISPAMVAVARDAAPDCTFTLADAAALPFPDAGYSITASMTALEFMPQPEQAVREMVRCTKPDGRLLIGTLNRNNRLNHDRLAAGEPPFASGHLYTPADLWALLSQWGAVRMLSSSGIEAAETLSQRIATSHPDSDSSLTGPLLVAEVALCSSRRR